METKNKSIKQRHVNFAELRLEVEEAEDILRALRTGEVGAVIVESPGGERIYTLQSTDHHYRLLIEAMSEGAVIMTGDGLVLYSNAGFAAMLKAPLDQVIGCN